MNYSDKELKKYIHIGDAMLEDVCVTEDAEALALSCSEGVSLLVSEGKNSENGKALQISTSDKKYLGKIPRSLALLPSLILEKKNLIVVVKSFTLTRAGTPIVIVSLYVEKGESFNRFAE